MFSNGLNRFFVFRRKRGSNLPAEAGPVRLVARSCIIGGHVVYMNPFEPPATVYFLTSEATRTFSLSRAGSRAGSWVVGIPKEDREACSREDELICAAM